MPNFACTLFFRANDNGWSETYYRADQGHAEAMSKTKELLIKRLALSPPMVTCIGARVSALGNPRDSVNFIPNTAQYSAGGYTTAPLQVGINLANDALLIELRSSPARKNRKFLRGMPDDLFQDGVFAPPDAWMDTFDANAGFAGTLRSALNGWSVKCRVATVNPPYTLSEITEVVPLRATSRRTGRPFGQSAGRRRTTRSQLIRAARSAILHGRVTLQDLTPPAGGGVPPP